MNFKTRLILPILSIFWSLSAFDLPVFYRAPYFQDTFGKNEAKYTTQFSVRYMHGETRKAWNNHSDKKSLFSSYGYTDITQMGLNIENPNDLVKEFWVDDTAPFNPNHYTPTGNQGKIDFRGKFETNEVDLTIQQDIFWGFFAQIYAPFKDIKFKDLSYSNLGPNMIGQTGHQISVQTFMNDNLNPILNSMGLKNYDKPYSKSTVPEILGSIGWHKYVRVISPIIKSISGTIQAGCLFPITGSMPDDVSFAIPSGYGEHWGTTLRANAFVGIFDWLGLGAHAGTTIFFSSHEYRRVKTAESQAGWILLEKIPCSMHTGQEWDLGGYLQIGPIFGFSVMGGYSYCKQETSEVVPRSNDYLKTYSQSQLNQEPWDKEWTQNGPYFPNVISKHDMANSDHRLTTWSMHTAHFVAKYEFTSEKFSPSIEFEYNYPFYSDYGWPTDTYGGTANLMFKFKF